MRSLVALLAVFHLTGCGSTSSLSTQGSLVQLINDRPNGCNEVGQFYGRGANKAYALNNLKNIAGESGANYLLLTGRDVIDATIVIGNAHAAYGRGFACKDQP